MTHLILVRHSQPQVDLDLPAHRWVLSLEGRRRCRPLAEAVAAYHPTALICSVEPKARETGAIVAAHLGIGHDVAEGLHEHERQTAAWLATADFHRVMARFFAQPDMLVFGEETAWQAQERFAGVIEQIVAHYPQKTLVVVAHGTVITLLAARHAGVDPFPLWRRLGLPSFVVFEMPGYCLGAIEDDFSA